MKDISFYYSKTRVHAGKTALEDPPRSRTGGTQNPYSTWWQRCTDFYCAPETARELHERRRAVCCYARIERHDTACSAGNSEPPHGRYSVLSGVTTDPVQLQPPGGVQRLIRCHHRPSSTSTTRSSGRNGQGGLSDFGRHRALPIKTKKLRSTPSFIQWGKTPTLFSAHSVFQKQTARTMTRLCLRLTHTS